MRWSIDNWLSKAQAYDKWNHASGSCFITLFLYLIINLLSPYIWLVNVAMAGALCFVGGIGLEVWQGYYCDDDGFSWKDLVADVIGIALAIAAVSI